MNEDKRLRARAVIRNREPILMVLRDILPDSGCVLEVASGSGEHIIYFGQNLPHLGWVPSDIKSEALHSIQSWRSYAKSKNIEPPIYLNVSEVGWSFPENGLAFRAIVAINLIHVASWQVYLNFMRGAARNLSHGGIVYLYGPFKRDGRHTSSGNQAFDISLRHSNEEWGIRDLNEVRSSAEALNFILYKIVEMPSNNLSLIFRLERPNMDAFSGPPRGPG